MEGLTLAVGLRDAGSRRQRTSRPSHSRERMRRPRPLGLAGLQDSLWPIGCKHVGGLRACVHLSREGPPTELSLAREPQGNLPRARPASPQRRENHQSFRVVCKAAADSAARRQDEIMQEIPTASRGIGSRFYMAAAHTRLGAEQRTAPRKDSAWGKTRSAPRFEPTAPWKMLEPLQ